MKPARLFLLLVCALCSCTAVAQSTSPPATLFSFDFPGATNTQATAINIGGKIVGRYTSPDGVQHGFLFNGTHFKSIDPPGSTFTDVTWINRYGQISGSYATSDGKTHGFVLSPGVFTTIDYPGAQTTLGFGVGDNGDVVGIAFTNGVLQGYLLRHGAFSLITFPGADTTLPAMIVGNRIVGGYFIGSTGQGFLRSNGVYHSIGCPGDGNVFLSGLDPAGDMVGGVNTADGKQHGLLVRNGKCVLVDFPGGSNAYANGIANGNIVGRYTDASGKVHGFLTVGLAGAEK
jgi:probable HAF family extracellular repeat protein